MESTKVKLLTASEERTEVQFGPQIFYCTVLRTEIKISSFYTTGWSCTTWDKQNNLVSFQKVDTKWIDRGFTSPSQSHLSWDTVTTEGLANRDKMAKWFHSSFVL